MAFLLCAMPLFSQTITLDLFASGFTSPVDLQNAGDDRLFVVEKRGVIKVLNADGTTNATPFLDIQDRVFTPTNSFDERGLLGLAFHPDYETNGYFYVHYSDNSEDTQISRFSVTGDPDVADPNSEFPIIDYNQPFLNHNGGALAFGPNDGYLYISSGDGGSSGDPGDRAQNTMLLLGKLLRIDVDNPGGGNNYGIPNDNPFFGSATNAEEIWAYGLRNPWKFSFDPLNGDIWIGDVGQGDVEEVDRATGTEAGLNYGWRCYEGSQPFNTTGCPPMGDLTFPFTEYSSSPGSGNCSVTGGYVYRGTVYADILGRYFYADVCGGFIASVDSGANVVDHGNFGGQWVSFGVDNAGEMYVVDLDGPIYKIEGGVLSTDDIQATATLRIAPNPVSDELTVSLGNRQLQSIEIFDLQGRRTMSRSGLNTESFSLSTATLSKGVYLVKVVTDTNQTLIQKLIKQN